MKTKLHRLLLTLALLTLSTLNSLPRRNRVKAGQRLAKGACLIALALLSTLNLQLSTVFAQGTAFSYQGRLNDGGSPATGIYDLRFAVCDALASGNVVAGPKTNSATGVTNGLFAVTLDFGSGVFTGSNRWVEIAARTNGAAAFTTLAPRQPIQPVPYAIMANSASNLLGTLPAGQLTGTVANGALPASPTFSGTVTAGSFSGNGANLTSLNANNLSSGTLGLAQLPASVITNGASGVTITGTFTGNGSGLTNLNAQNIAGYGTWVTNYSLGLASINGVGNSPQSVAAFKNVDGKLDLVCANQTDNTLTVLTNNGSGSFGSNATYTVGSGPSYVTAADVNGDGKVDLVCANDWDYTLTVLTNNGSGSFGSNATYTVGYDSPCVIAADVNGDGKVDLISGNEMAEDGNTLTVLTNSGGGIFGFSATYTADYCPRSVCAADVNGDGKVDLISANYEVSTLTVLTNNGSGIFGSNATYTVGRGPSCVIAADANGDGLMDLICANDWDYTLTVLTNSGTASFSVNSKGGNLPAGLLTNNASGVTLSGTFTGNGANLTSLNANNLASGTVPLARLGGLTSNQLDAATWQLATNLNGGNAALASNVVSGLAITNAFITNSVFAGNGANLTSLNANNLANGTVPVARLGGLTSNQLDAATWQLATNLNGGNAALATNVVAGIAITNAFITNSVFAGNGGGLTNLNASQLSSGSIPLTELPAAVITNNSANLTIGGTTAVAPLTVPPKVPAAAIGSGATSYPAAVKVAGRYAYVVSFGAGTLQIFDVSTPSTPALIGSVNLTPGANQPCSVTVAGRYAYVVSMDPGGTLQIYDVSNPSAPVAAGYFSGLAGPAVSVAVSGRYAYVGTLVNKNLQVIDVSNPSSPVSVGSVATTGTPDSVAVAGRYAYVANNTSSGGVNALQIFDVSNPSSPVSVGSLATGAGSSTYSVAVAGAMLIWRTMVPTHCK